MNPTVAASKEAIMMAIFAISMVATSVNDKLVTKMDMVKPIPPKMHAPNRSIHFNCPGFLAHFAFTEKKENKKIPSGLPTTSPPKIPKAGNS